MNFKYRIHYAPSPAALAQAARVGANMAVIHSVGPCSHLWFARDPASGRDMDEFPIYFDAYPKVAAIRRGADAGWIERLRAEIRALSARALELGLKPVIHFYEPMLPLAFEREYPELVGVYKRPTQDGTVDVHTCAVLDVRRFHPAGLPVRDGRSGQAGQRQERGGRGAAVGRFPVVRQPVHAVGLRRSPGRDAGGQGDCGLVARGEAGQHR
jgi:hypothetical protein